MYIQATICVVAAKSFNDLQELDFIFAASTLLMILLMHIIFFTKLNKNFDKVLQKDEAIINSYGQGIRKLDLHYMNKSYFAIAYFKNYLIACLRTIILVILTFDPM